MKIRTLLKFLILEILVILLIFIAFAILYDSSTKEIRESSKITETQMNNLRGLSIDISEFHNGKLSYEKLEKNINLVSKDIKNNINNKDISNEFNKISKNIGERQVLIKENNKLIDSIYKNTDASMKESREYVEKMVNNLADLNERHNVSVLERLVIVGAEKNTYNNLMIQNYTEKLKSNFDDREKLLNFLNEAIENSQKDIKRLEGTEFYNNVKLSNNLLKDINLIVKTYIENTYKIYEYESSTFENLNTLNSMINDYNEGISNNLYNNLNKSITFVSILIFAMLLISITFTVLIYRSINSNLKLVMNYVNKLKVGNLSNIIKIKSRNEFSEITNLLSSYADDLKSTLLDKLEKIANGEKISGSIVKGKDDEIGPKIETMQNTINGLVREIDIITNESLNGNLNHRIYAEGFKGEYRKILNGINKTLDYIIEPFLEVSDVMSNIEEGQFEIKVKNYKGDFKILGSSIENMVNYLKKIITEISETLYQIAEGNLDVLSLDEYTGDYKKISSSINKIINNLNLLVGNISKSSEYVSDSSKNLEKSSKNLSDDASNMASSIQEISASIQEMNSQTKSSVENAKEADKLVKETNDNANDGKNLMNSMLISMEEINKSSRNIRKIIKVIDEIAFKTNILAINASIEAEQAGQYGKGFSVVADEVRSLAAKCANAAKNTTEMIEESINKVSTGIKISNETSKALLSINKNATSSKQIVENIARASEENAVAFEQMNLAVIQISDGVQKTSAISSDSALSSEKLAKESNNLKKVVEKFTLKNNKNSIKNNFNVNMDDEVEFDVNVVEKSY